eukprot:TRINITY_DN93567_c0_g1_i1.p1 TRINITY_DN93567_c0_g1~~TRINITY_DN93567_c0_g1_i1.p1  ORF type:complete len:349 (-),score=51.00 TRINITY_DN93567_c0_g1_i1:321-1367(-)
MDDHAVSAYEAAVDILTGVAYFAIPAQISRLACMRVSAFDYRKLTSKMSYNELNRTRLLIGSFACFIIACGIGHILLALKLLTGDLLVCRILVFTKSITCMLSVVTAIVVSIWVPSLITWLQDVELHRKGFMKLASEEVGNGWQSRDVEIEDLQAQISMLEAERTALLHKEILNGKLREEDEADTALRGRLQASLHTIRVRELSEKLQPSMCSQVLVLKAGKHRHKMTKSQLFLVLASVHKLQNQEPIWSEQPEETWGAFLGSICDILGATSCQHAQMFDLCIEENWHATVHWALLWTTEELKSIIDAAFKFYRDPSPAQASHLATTLGRAGVSTLRNSSSSGSSSLN